MGALIPSAERIVDRCESLARLSEQKNGLTRIYLSDQHRAANSLVGEWMEQAGMTVRVDAVGNVCGRCEGERPGLPCLMLGSHLDTVRDAGKYDGVLGVVTAIECVATLEASGRQELPYAVEVIGFADEEGVRFGSTLLGSRAVAGRFDSAVLDALDNNGITMREAMRCFGLDEMAIGSALRRAEEVLAYAELHIEQGPVLEESGLPVGAVTAINGGSRYTVEIVGVAGHAGTVPMQMRRDALAAAADCALEIERICKSSAEIVGTVGQIEVAPGAVNVIPGWARFSIDVRSPDDSLRAAAVRAIHAKCRQICARRSVAVNITHVHESRTTVCAPWLVEQIGKAIAAEGVEVRRLPSGAGHDATAMAELTDVAMLFVRCKGGSHNPAEAVVLEDVTTAARVFLHFIENFCPDTGKSIRRSNAD